MASQPIIEEGAVGVLESLNTAGYVDGELLHFTRFNVERDLATANSIAQELAGGGYDLVIKLATGALQTVANSNRQGRVRYVFGQVAAPVNAGVGITIDPLDHPQHLAGIETFPGEDNALRLARRMNLRLKRA